MNGALKSGGLTIRSNDGVYIQVPKLRNLLVSLACICLCLTLSVFVVLERCYLKIFLVLSK